MQTRKRVTIKDVALAAGVSTQTVSRVLNNRRDVSMETREKILGIINQMGYSPNVLARSLIQGRSHTLGVIGYGLSYYGPSRVLTGIERRARELGYSLLLSLLREPDTNDGQEVFHSLLSRQVDGIIWAVPEIGDNREWVVAQISGASQTPASVPIVFINMEPLPGLAVTAVDNREGGRLATEHLLAQGYQQIGIITGPSTWWEAQQRELGWRNAMQNARENPCDLDALKIAGDWYPSSGEKGLEALIRRCPNLQAVFACNDPMAAGALLAARRIGLRVPEDLAVVGFDDVPEAAFYYPSLTTVRQPLAELGGRAVDQLIELLSNHNKDQEGEPLQSVWLHPQLIIRDSSMRK